MWAALRAPSRHGHHHPNRDPSFVSGCALPTLGRIRSVRRLARVVASMTLPACRNG
jgi:hypothetical protein